MNPDETAKGLLGTVMRLSGLIAEENKRLDAPGRVAGLEQIVKEKQLLSQSYEHQLKAFSDPEARTKVKPELLHRLAEAGNAMGALMEENRRKIEAKMEATKTIFKIMAEAAREFRQASAGYGRTGAPGTDARRARQAYQPAVSLGVNREL